MSTTPNLRPDSPLPDSYPSAATTDLRHPKHTSQGSNEPTLDAHASDEDSEDEEPMIRRTGGPGHLQVQGSDDEADEDEDEDYDAVEGSKMDMDMRDEEDVGETSRGVKWTGKGRVLVTRMTSK